MTLADNTIYKKPARAQDYMTFLYGLMTRVGQLWECMDKDDKPTSLFEDLAFPAGIKKGISQKLCHKELVVVEPQSPLYAAGPWQINLRQHFQGLIRSRHFQLLAFVAFLALSI